MHELAIKIPHKAARRLAWAVRIAVNASESAEERTYLMSLYKQLTDFAATQPPTYIRVTVVAIDGVSVEPK
jgi:hypothetical protein